MTRRPALALSHFRVKSQQNGIHPLRNHDVRRVRRAERHISRDSDGSSVREGLSCLPDLMPFDCV